MLKEGLVAVVRAHDGCTSVGKLDALCTNAAVNDNVMGAKIMHLLGAIDETACMLILIIRPEPRALQQGLAIIRENGIASFVQCCLIEVLLRVSMTIETVSVILKIGITYIVRQRLRFN